MCAKYHFLPLAVSLALLAGGCSNRKSAETPADSTATDSVPSAVSRLIQAVNSDDPESFAGIVSYPLQRPYPLHDIENAEQMKAYYKEMVDDSLKHVLSRATTGNWSEYGWRGWTLDDGSYVWVDDSLYDIPYVSAKERVLIDSLTRAEINSIAPSIREGWKPVMCMVHDASGRVYRIDSRTDEEAEPENEYRVAIYQGMSSLRDVPASLLQGEMESEGTMGTLVYRFKTPSGKDLLIEPEAPDTGIPTLIEPNDSAVELRRAYWHDLVNGK